MKFLERLRAPKTESEKTMPKEPRLLGCDAPYYSGDAKDAFLAVLNKGTAVSRSSAALSFTDAAVELEQAVKEASQYCNEELKARMLAFRDAVIDLSMGDGSPAEEQAAREHFTMGCRLALGTNN